MSGWSIFSPSDKKRTFKKIKDHDKPTAKRLHDSLKTSLDMGCDLRQAVKCPSGEDMNEWLAMNVCDFFNEISLLYGSIVDYCTEESCPIMMGGPQYEYWWADGEKIKEPIRVSAPRYAELLMTWIQKGVPFPKRFKRTIDVIMKRILRIYAHIYHYHSQKMKALGTEAHLNSCFKHFIYFIEEFDCIRKEELEPLNEYIESLKISKKKHDCSKQKEESKIEEPSS